MNNKTRIRITESDLHRIVRESVNKVLRENLGAYGEDPNYTKRSTQSLRNYWAKKGLQGDELEQKVKTVMQGNASRRNRGGRGQVIRPDTLKKDRSGWSYYSDGYRIE